MAQRTYLSTYRAYRLGTKRLTTWLAQAAQRCGIDVKTLATDRHQIPLEKLVELTRSITQSKGPKIRVPQEVVAIIKAVIALCKEVGATLAKLTGKSEEDVSQATHQHFVSMFERLLELLEPPAAASTTEEQVSTGADLPSLFAALNIEEPSDVSAPSHKPAKGKAQLAQEYEVEDTSTEHSLFAVLAFVKDFAEIEKLIQGAWLHYQKGRLDLMAAAVTTGTAYLMIKHSCEDLSASIPGNRTYGDICSMFDDERFREAWDWEGTLSNKLSKSLALPAHSILCSYAEVLKEKEVVVYNGISGFYQPDPVPKGHTDEQVRLQDQQLLMEYLPEITRLSRFNLSLPAQDVLTSGLREMMDGNNMEACPMYAIFATKLFLSVHQVLRIIPGQPLSDLQDTATRCVHTIDDWPDFSKHMKNTNWPVEKNEPLREMQAFVKEWVVEDRMGKAHRTMSSGRGLQPQPFQFLRRNPVVCGLLVLRLNLQLQEIGQQVVAAWGSAIYPLHLYNACRQSKGLAVVWEDAEYLYQLQMAQRILAGGAPKDPQEYLQRFLTIHGAGASKFARDRQPGGIEMAVKAKKNPRGLKTTSPVKDIFYAQVVRNADAVLSRSNLSALLAVANKNQRSHPPLDDVEALSRHVGSQAHITPAQILSIVREGLAAEEMHLVLDYFAIQ